MSTRNIQIKLKRLYGRYKFTLVCALVLIIANLINTSEQYVIDKIILVSKTSSSENTISRLSVQRMCPSRVHYKTTPFNSQYSMFYWNKQEHDIVYKIRTYSCYFTYIFTGALANRYGGQKLILLSLIVTSSIFTVQYLAILQNAFVFVMMVAIRRFGHGMLVIAWVSLAIQWSRSNRRSTFVGIMVASIETGNFLGYVIPRLLNSWAYTCYFSCSLGFITACWWWIVTKHPEYRHTKNIRFNYIPWRGILTSKPLYILSLLIISDGCIMFTKYSSLYYLQKVVHLNITIENMEHYVLVLLLQVTGIISCFYIGISSDFIISKRLVPTSTIRKFFLALVLPIVVLATLVLTKAKCNVVVVLTCCLVMEYLSCMNRVNVITIIADTSPLFAPTLYGITNFIGSIITSSAMFILTEQIPPEASVTLKSWREVFYTAGVTIVLTAIPYLFFGQKTNVSSTGNATDRSQIELHPLTSKINIPTGNHSAPEALTSHGSSFQEIGVDKKNP